MCAIFGSANKEKIIELAQLNSSRGSHSWSLTAYNSKMHRMNEPRRELGEFNSEILNNYHSGYFICHIQAPTTKERSLDSVHPADDCGDYLWHNGIIKEEQVKAWQEEWDKDWEWDTYWLLYQLNAGDPYNFLSETNGGFAGVWYHKYAKGLRLFRNEFTPLFIDEKSFDISSTKADDMKPLNANAMVELNFKDKTVSIAGRFKTKENPYFFGE